MSDDALSVSAGRQLSRRGLFGLSTVAGGALVIGAGSRATAEDNVAPAGPADRVRRTRRVTLYAERVRGGFGYGLAPGAATVPGPTLAMYEGDRLEVTLVNRTDKRLSMHAHGVDYDVHSDGTPTNDGCVSPGARRTFIFRSHRASRRPDGTVRPGSAGYWHYHDHCMGSPHGTAGIQAGLYGALIVRRKGDPLPKRAPFVVVFLDATINGKVEPHTPTFVANEGDRVEWVVIGHMHAHHTFHLHGHRWADSRTGNIFEVNRELPVIDNKTIGPGDSFGFQVVAGEGVGPGAWMYHCHVQFHADGGMAGIFLVRDRDGQLPPGATDALARFRATQPTGHRHRG